MLFLSLLRPEIKRIPVLVQTTNDLNLSLDAKLRNCFRNSKFSQENNRPSFVVCK